MNGLAEAIKPLVADLASTILFAILIAVTGNIFLATGLGIALGIGQVLVQKLRGKEIALMQWMSLVLVVVFGTLTLYFHDPRFVMVKFTIAHIAIGAVMITPNWMSRYLPKIVTDTLSARELTFYSAMWPVMMFGLAAANLYIGFEMSQAAWTWFLATVPPAAPWVLFGLQYLTIRLRVRSIIRRRMAAEAAAAPAE
ncbi:MAG TPA: septation protein IspZ [Rhizomicrobium sp.]|jgi:intracellular septation protein A|nr:septation protein IspZ [Rhizomicrobium sp.]